MDIAVTLARLLVASVFLMAGWVKLADGAGLIQTIRKFGIVPKPLVDPIARVLPWVEFVCGVMLFVGVLVVPTAILVSLLMVSFIAVSIWAIKRKLNLQCDCFGILYREKIGPATIKRDAVLLLAAVSLVVADDGHFTFASLLARRMTAVDVAMLGITVMSLGLSSFVAYRASRLPFRLPWRRGGVLDPQPE